MKSLFLFSFLFVSFYCYSQKSITFYQKNKIQILIKPVINFEKIEISTSKNHKTQIIDSIQTSITGKEMHLEVADYNFDGYQDFACYRTDDGMGVYTIYQIFLYERINEQFKLLQIPSVYNPNCDEFCDIKIDKKNKTMQSSCRAGARWHVDIWKFDKNNKLLLVKK